MRQRIASAFVGNLWVNRTLGLKLGLLNKICNQWYLLYFKKHNFYRQHLQSERKKLIKNDNTSLISKFGTILGQNFKIQAFLNF